MCLFRKKTDIALLFLSDPEKKLTDAMAGFLRSNDYRFEFFHRMRIIAVITNQSADTIQSLMIKNKIFEEIQKPKEDFLVITTLHHKNLSGHYSQSLANWIRQNFYRRT